MPCHNYTKPGGCRCALAPASACVRHLRSSMGALQLHIALAAALRRTEGRLPCEPHRRNNCTYAHNATSLSHLLSVLAGAKSSISVCVFTITCNEIACESGGEHGC